MLIEFIQFFGILILILGGSVALAFAYGFAEMLFWLKPSGLLPRKDPDDSCGSVFSPEAISLVMGMDEDA